MPRLAKRFLEPEVTSVFVDGLAQLEGQVVARYGTRSRLLLPADVALIETPTHFGIEFHGLRRAGSGRPQSLVHVKLSQALDLLGLLESPDVAHAIDCSAATTSGVASMDIVPKIAMSRYAERYPGILAYHSTRLHVQIDAHTVNALSLPPTDGYVKLGDLIAVNASPAAVRARYVHGMCILGRDALQNDAKTYLREAFGGLRELAVLDPGTSSARERSIRVTSLLSVTSVPRMGETRITEIVWEHGLLEHAFGRRRVLYQPQITMVERESLEQDMEWIQPDFLLVREGGSADICDFKLPLHGHRSITVGRPGRTRYLAEVHEGISQLAHYRDILRRPAHRAQLEEKYGTFVDAPRLILVIGNADNALAAEIAAAQRGVSADVEVVDYDSFLVLAAGAQEP